MAPVRCSGWMSVTPRAWGSGADSFARCAYGGRGMRLLISDEHAGRVPQDRQGGGSVGRMGPREANFARVRVTAGGESTCGSGGST
jgi:hypothetical protein